jgi:hypothetical protein
VERVLTLPFESHGHKGRVHVAYGAVTDSDRLGFNMLGVGLQPHQPVGYPVVKADIDFDGDGCSALFGWVQVIHNTAWPPELAEEVDLPPFLLGSNTPMMYFGYLPTMFDAPANPHHPDGDWTAFTFLTAIPDLVVSRSVQALTGFRWGYRLACGQPTPISCSRSARTTGKAASGYSEVPSPLGRSRRALGDMARPVARSSLRRGAAPESSSVVRHGARPAVSE